MFYYIKVKRICQAKSSLKNGATEVTPLKGESNEFNQGTYSLRKEYRRH